MKRRLVAIGLLVLMLLGLVSCAAEPEEKDPIQEFIENKAGKNDTYTGFWAEDEKTKDPLTICMDVEYVQRDWTFPKPLGTILNDFLYTLDQSGGVSDVEILYVPKYGADREARLDRLRVEIMAGKGPDVFIMNSCGALNIQEPESEALFVYPEQAMENGLFLPLDDYMENKTRFAEWDKQTPCVLAAGRNEEGQQIIPLVYTLPILCIRKSDVDMDLTGASYTWDDMLQDPEISPYTRLMADCCTPQWDDEFGVGVVLNGTCYLEFSLGELADFEEEELTFTEEELKHQIQEILALYDEQVELSETLEPDTKGEFDYYCTWLGWDMISNLHPTEDNILTEEPKSMFPLYSKDGGVTATILSWAAVSRNTNKPDEAYTVIDMLMRENVQQKFMLYENILVGTGNDGVPMHEGLLHPDMPFGRGMEWSLTEENYNELCEIRSQITGANFHGELSIELVELFNDCVAVHAGIHGYEDYPSVEEMIHETYETMQRKVRE